MHVNGKTILAAIIMAISCFIIANTVVQPQPISIKIEDANPIIIQAPAVYGEREVLTVVVASWIAGISTMYLYFESSKKVWAGPRIQVPITDQGNQIPHLQELETINTALKVLREPGKKVLEIIVNKGGDILQKDLCLETDYSRAKISRTLRELEARDIIQRRQYGGTKRIMLSDWMKKGTALNIERS
jgi:uncharacterized membrane protein